MVRSKIINETPDADHEDGFSRTIVDCRLPHAEAIHEIFVRMLSGEWDVACLNRMEVLLGSGGNIFEGRHDLASAAGEGETR